jgi:hypothetical protein
MEFEKGLAMASPTSHRSAIKAVSGLLAIAPIFIGGLVLFALVKRRRVSLIRLKRAILGNRRQTVISLLGPPRIQTARGDAWYYPLEEWDKSAIAVLFNDDIVREVEIFRGGQG